MRQFREKPGKFNRSHFQPRAGRLCRGVPVRGVLHGEGSRRWSLGVGPRPRGNGPDSALFVGAEDLPVRSTFGTVEIRERLSD